MDFVKRVKGRYSLFAAISETSLLRQTASKAVPQAIGAYNAMDFSMALNAALTLSGSSNQYLAEKAPWTLLKKASPLSTDIIILLQKEVAGEHCGLLSFQSTAFLL